MGGSRGGQGKSQADIIGVYRNTRGPNASRWDILSITLITEKKKNVAIEALWAEFFGSAHGTNIDIMCTRCAYKVHNLLLFSAVVCTCSAQRVETFIQALLYGEF